MKRMSNNLIQLGDLKHFSTCTNHIRTIPEFRHFGQMTQKSRSPGIEHAWASNIEKSLEIGGEGYPNVFNVIQLGALFLVACTRLYKSLCQSVRWSVPFYFFVFLSVLSTFNDILRHFETF